MEEDLSVGLQGRGKQGAMVPGGGVGGWAGRLEDMELITLGCYDGEH